MVVAVAVVACRADPVWGYSIEIEGSVRVEGRDESESTFTSSRERRQEEKNEPKTMADLQIHLFGCL